MINFKKKEGFTLIELLVVMAIVAVLSTLAVNGYTSYRRSALLDLAADSVVSQLYAMKDKAMHGSVTNNKFQSISARINGTNEEEEVAVDSALKCYGMKFSTGTGIKKFETGYDNRKTWDSVTGGWDSEGCLPDLLNESSIDLDENVIKVEGIFSIDSNDPNGIGVSVSDVVLEFEPPDGNITSGAVGGNFPLDAEKIRVVISYGGSEDANYKRNIFIDLKSGKSYVTQFENEQGA